MSGGQCRAPLPPPPSSNMPLLPLPPSLSPKQQPHAADTTAAESPPPPPPQASPTGNDGGGCEIHGTECASALQYDSGEEYGIGYSSASALQSDRARLPVLSLMG